ncbi:NAD(P)H-dependent oxidoreductase [uncultured Rhodospira sp.]|uniref:NAD(P)H-dependent oxidoreductase n=1 Tax=uncultured Rhodospira sp. TaxID=1936189 RepID=UPI0026348A60|nr:NAD(P)H-dependent oxidoreductase [uncultured Rhodospira sp.]
MTDDPLPKPATPDGRRVLIVHAHPEPRSFTAAMRDVAVETLRARGDAVVISDLYADGFDAVVKAADFPERRDPDYLTVALEQRHADESGTLPPDIRRELDRLLWADLVIFSFPLFWFSVPAILKGWIDRVLVSGRCYGGRRFYDRGGLRGKTGLLALTMGGRAHMVASGGVHGPLEDMLRPLLQGTLGYVGMRVLPPFVAHHVPYISDEARRAILADYRAFLETLDALEPLPMPALDAFDDQMRPLG